MLHVFVFEAFIIDGALISSGGRLNFTAASHPLWVVFGLLYFLGRSLIGSGWKKKDMT